MYHLLRLHHKNEILNYFQIIEKINIPQEQRDLIVFKKALFLIKISNNKKDGNELLENLIKNNSKLNSLAKEVLNK